VEFRILGPLEVVGEAGPVPLPRGRGRALLAVLVMHVGTVVSTDRLIDELWGHTPPPTAMKALHGLISALRRYLEPARSIGAQRVVETCPPGYVLAVDRDQVDANRFRRLVGQAVDAPAPTRAAMLREALGLWRGPALADFLYQPFAQRAIVELEELRLAATEERIDADLALGRHTELTGELEGLIAGYPVRERLREQLILALYRAGRQAEALEVYVDTRRILADQLGIDVGPGLQRLQQAILHQDQSLDLPPSTQVVPTDIARAWLPAGLKTVTTVFADLSPSGAATGTSDPEVDRRIARRCFDAAAEVVNRHGGTVERFIGGVFVAVFGVPSAHEDDALRAVRAAAELRDDVQAMDGQVAARVGVNTGEVLVGNPVLGRAEVSGDPVNIALRLQQAAGAGEVLLGETTRRLAGDAVAVDAPEAVLGARGRPTTSWRLAGLVPGTPVRAPQRDTPMVGRAEELAQLRTAFDRTAREHVSWLYTVIGEAGIGKSRMALEIADMVAGEAMVLTGHCPAYGDGITFWPLREIVLQAIGDRGWDGVVDLLSEEDDGRSTAALVAGAIGLAEEPGQPAELFPAIRRFLEVIARRQPLLVILEDAHWAQPMFLDLVEYLVGSTTHAVLFLCLARPDLLEQRPTWSRDRDNATLLLLEPLGPDDSERLIADRLAGRALAPETAQRLVQMAQGNPLFMEQMLASLRDEREPGIPPSLQALLAARLDRLGPAERDLIRCASVAGLEFSLDALAALVPDDARPFVSRHLQVLEGKELVGASRQRLHGKTTLTFRHVLIQLAAYRSMTRQSRSELHERFAGWLENVAGGTSLQNEEIIGYHLEQAHTHRRDLGLLDEHTRTLAIRAGDRLAGAGLRAYARFDMAAAENLLSRAKALMAQEHPQRWIVTRRLAETYPVLGRLAEADAAFGELLDTIRPESTGGLAPGIRLERLRIRLIAGPDPVRLDTIRTAAERAMEEFGRSADHVGMSQASYLLSFVHLRSGRMLELEEEARRGLAHADLSGEVREQIGAQWWVTQSLVAGATPVPECIRMCDELAQSRGMTHPGVLSDLARLRAMVGQFAEARELLAEARRVLVERMRVRRALTFVAQRAAEVELLAGDVAAVEAALRPALEMAADMGERDQISQIAADLSRLLSRRGEPEEAARLASQCTASAPSESVTARALSYAAQARVLATRTHHREAEHLLHDALRIVPHDMLNLRAGLHVELADTLEAAGQRKAALAVISEAGNLYQRKGNIVGACHARRVPA
jgi:predicted ATPase/class 3 adenylate cyclase/DNA-binding winged helix-turn-helix (wHTH) protein